MSTRSEVSTRSATPPGLPAARLATRLAFLVAGFGVACWAPLVPFAKQRLGVDNDVLGLLLLLCIGVGSVMAMSVTGVVVRGTEPSRSSLQAASGWPSVCLSCPSPALRPRRELRCLRSARASAPSMSP